MKLSSPCIIAIKERANQHTIVVIDKLVTWYHRRGHLLLNVGGEGIIGPLVLGGERLERRGPWEGGRVGRGRRMGQGRQKG